MKRIRTIALVVLGVAVLLTVVHFSLNTDWVGLIQKLHQR